MTRFLDDRRPKHLSVNFRQIRESLGLSQNQLIQRVLAWTVGLTHAEISTFELAKRVPPLIVLLRYARLMEIHVDDLIDDDIQLDC